MSLDLFQKDNNDQIALAQRSSAAELPAMFGEAFTTAWDENRLFGQSIAGANARQGALDDYIEEVRARTGKTIGVPTSERAPGFEQIAAEVDGLRATHPDLTPLTEDELDRRAIAKSSRARAENAAMNAREKTVGGAIGSFAGTAAGTMTDPVNVLAFPLAAPLGAGVVGTALAWSGIAGGTQAAIELLGVPYREQVQPGYMTSGEPLVNIVEAGAFGGLLGGGIKGLGAVWTRAKTGSWPRSIRDAGNVVESEAQVQATNLYPGVEGEAAHRTALQQSIDDMVAGRPVNVDGVVTPSILRAYEERLAPVMDARSRALAAQESAVALERDSARLPATMERLSEQQLADIRGTAQRVQAEAAALTDRLAGERQSIDAGRAQLGQATDALTARQRDLAAAQNDLATVQQRLDTARPPTDPVTEARLAQIEGDLSKPNLAAADRARLEGERASIVETLAKTAPGDARLIRSLEQEAKALTRIVARHQKDIARLEAAQAKNAERLTSREKSLPVREQTGQERVASRLASVQTEMRKAVTSLANDGYGLRLPRTDAEEFAARIIGASDQEVEQILRDLTETLVDRATQARRAAPQADLPFGQQAPAAQKLAEKGHWTEQMRKGVTALAREVGYVMPREEAAAIAARLAGMSDHEALAVLDELMLRPRTLAEVFPGTLAARGEPAILDNVPTGARDALAAETSPKRAAEVMSDPITDEAVVRDLDRLRAEKGDIDVPMGTAIGQDGIETAAHQNIGKIIDDADMRLAAAKEIAACTGPQPEAG